MNKRMRYNDVELTKKNSFWTIIKNWITDYGKIILVIMAFFILSGVQAYAANKLCPNFCDNVLTSILGGMFATSIELLIIRIIHLCFQYINAHIKSLKRMQYIPLSAEECEKLNIKSLDDYISIVNDIITISYWDNLYKKAWQMPQAILKQTENFCKEYFKNDKIELEIDYEFKESPLIRDKTYFSYKIMQKK